MLDLVLLCGLIVFVFKQKTAYEMRISDWSSDVCSSDLVRIIVFGQQEMTGDYRVGDSGSISLPLLGVVEADGKTIKELETSIEKSLAQGYVVDPSVSVEILASRPFYILGEVQKPGQYPYAGAGMTVRTEVKVGGGRSAEQTSELQSLKS